MASVTERLDESCTCLAFSPYKESAALLAVGGQSRITVKDSSSVGSLLDSLSLSTVFSLLCGDGVGVSHFSWSPDTAHTEDGSGRYVFCTTGHSHQTITVYRCDVDSTTTESLPGHTSYINDLTFHPCDSSLLASVGDDRICRVWDLNEGQVRSEFRLKSPGVAVKWHPQDPAKLLVAEKSGRVRLYDLATEVPIMCLETGTAPLMSVDWSPSNSLYVGGVASGSWFVWDVSQSSRPLECRSVYQGPSSLFSWCPQSEGVFATVGLGRQLKVHHLGHQKIPISCDLPVVTDISWHARIPLLAAAVDKQLHFWMPEI
ncbi:nucleoporin Nup37-like isoform X2 [Halichondria panicea]|uniref:nucleoporin Nup37-like isoform X2 n=1 Tax=Halichondria panicea TaxID=6063 RepID=UPI00312B724A